MMLPEVKSRTRPAGLFDIVSFDMAVRMQSLRSVDFQNFSRQRSAAHSMVLPKTHKAPDSYISITVGFGHGDGLIPLDGIVTVQNSLTLNNIAQKAEAYKPKPRTTYKMIKEYIDEKYRFKVHTAYIAEVKRSLGLPMYDAPNAVETLKNPRKHPTPIQVDAIKDALTYFEVI